MMDPIYLPYDSLYGKAIDIAKNSKRGEIR
jgi:hypothetical protein